ITSTCSTSGGSGERGREVRGGPPPAPFLREGDHAPLSLREGGSSEGALPPPPPRLLLLRVLRAARAAARRARRADPGRRRRGPRVPGERDALGVDAQARGLGL